MAYFFRSWSGTTLKKKSGSKSALTEINIQIKAKRCVTAPSLFQFTPPEVDT